MAKYVYICKMPICLLLFLQALCFVFARVEPIYYSYYPWRYNLSNYMAQNAYLPPDTSNAYLPTETPNLMLPEVIDNRARSPVNLQLPVSSADLYPVYQFSRNANNHPKAKLIAENSVFPEALPNQLTVTEMSCQNNAEELYFRATLSAVKNADHPTIENAGSSSCKITKYQNEYRIDFGKDEFWNCGVLDCSTDTDRHYCLKVRFPTITGLRLKDDFEVTLQCKAQNSIAVQTRHINVKTIDTASRMAPRIAAGGHKNILETEVVLYRKTFTSSENAFDAKIESGGTVILGEEILLRAAVRDGDGWKFAKMSEVTVHYVESRNRKKIMNSLWILDAEGCLNPQLSEITLGEQYRINPLESYLLFKAFMFDSMQETDEMVLTVKITGCLSGEDCILNCPAGRTRQARQINRNRREIGTSKSNQTIDWENDVTFRVLASAEKINKIDGLKVVLPYVMFGMVIVILICVLCVIQVFTRKRKRLYAE